MTKYAWTVGARMTADPQAVGEELHRLQREHRSSLTPRVVVDEARAATSALHGCFQWDDLNAAELYREQQARYVLRSIRVVTVEEDGKTPVLQHVYVNVVEQVGDDEQHRYVPLVRVLADRELLQQVRQQAARDLRAFEARYEQFAAVAKIGRWARRRVEQLHLPGSRSKRLAKR